MYVPKSQSSIEIIQFLSKLLTQSHSHRNIASLCSRLKHLAIFEIQVDTYVLFKNSYFIFLPWLSGFYAIIMFSSSIHPCYSSFYRILVMSFLTKFIHLLTYFYDFQVIFDLPRLQPTKINFCIQTGTVPLSPKKITILLSHTYTQLNRIFFILL